MSNAIQKAEERSVEFTPHGSQDKIKLTVGMVQRMVAVPTKSGRTCSERDAFKFIMLCRARRLDPFQGDAFLIGFDAKDGPQFSLITAHQAFLKRAELHPEFDGMKSGVIVLDGGKVVELEGDFHTEEQMLLGGWATVFFKTRKVPSHDKLALKNFMKRWPDGSPQGRWKDDPEGLIVKCAESSALRKAFPTMLGGLYMREEIEVSGQTLSDMPMPALEAEAAPADQPKGNEDVPTPGTASAKPAGGSGDSPQARLAALATENGFTWADYQRWGSEEFSGNHPGAERLSGWEHVPPEIATRLLRSPTGFVGGMKRVKEGKA